MFNAQSHRKLRSCLWSTATGLVEPLAAVLAVLALAPYITDATLDYSLLYVGGCVIVPLSSLNFLMINVNLPRQARDRHTTNAPKNNCDRFNSQGDGDGQPARTPAGGLVAASAGRAWGHGARGVHHDRLPLRLWQLRLR